MSKVQYFKTFPCVLRLPISRLQQDLLCLVLTFSQKGLKLSNAAIAELLGKAPSTINNNLRALAAKGLIETKKPRSKYRVIYPGNAESYLTDLNILLNRQSVTYLTGQGSQHNKVSKQKETPSAFSPASPGLPSYGDDDLPTEAEAEKVMREAGCYD
ncbi:MAG: winged helix-turn-helix transcriptional regulator [Planctomycetes bacterium]|nr:winged helix-turn-helix transcriptional regulator [Planctomycetota bacterium]MBL7145823.1 winged helix-turn-helix transcriptional regulator [Phycisphaerae bacterium]